ncbi:beta-glucosidase BglX [Mesohalobacter halotolerans]|uniref:beta-glucosidase n=1 Tax=Mesohalobacter halotolerans TaxID=1883405 RepID=A0A4U5TS21_9FLAO|nr:beta-glucosidase BglX [Mesohalobacter halotolerans]TKS56118.1 beta-glucosidase BglX [Mesohalobacter halotolerans]
MKYLPITFILSLFLTLSCTKSKDTDKSTDKGQSYRPQVDSLLSLMTLEEKVGQMVQYSGGWDITGPESDNNKLKKQQIKKGLVGSMLNVTSVEKVREAQKLAIENSRLKIPMIFGYDVIHGYKTMFPLPLAEAASWDLDLMERTAQVSAKEAAAAGINWTFAPMVDISRDARWGRIMESAGEDTYLNTVVGLAKMRGYQGESLSDVNTIAACAKHFAGYGYVKSGKEYNTVSIGEHELHNVVLPPFKALADAGIASFMNSFSDMDGIPATASYRLQTEVLKEKWDYNGMIVSDWGSVEELSIHGIAKDDAEAAKIAANAGNDMGMESSAYAKHLVQLVKDGEVDESRIDDAVSRILTLKYKLGLFDNPYKYCNEEREKTSIYTKAHLDLAYEAALKSIVLLKNKDKVLPISKDVKSIALIGPLADDKNSPLGNWRARAKDNSAISLYEGLKEKLPSTIDLKYHEGVDYVISGENFATPLKINTTDDSKIKNAVQLAKSQELVILAVGENAFQSGEGRSRTDISFPGLQEQLIKAVYDANPNTIMVLMNGRPMDISWSAQNIPAIVEAWHLGSQAGYAIADVLLGNYNPSGKLPVSFPQRTGQEPFFYSHKNTGRPDVNPYDIIHSQHNDVPNDPVFAFGHGLSYTTFEYGDIQLDKDSFSKGEFINVQIDVKNTGQRVGHEIVQLYIRDLVGSITRPVIELKDFKKIHLKPGETKTVEFEISESTIAFYTISKKWEAEPGEFKVFVGSSAIQNTSKSFYFK